MALPESAFHGYPTSNPCIKISSEIFQPKVLWQKHPIDLRRAKNPNERLPPISCNMEITWRITMGTVGFALGFCEVRNAKTHPIFLGVVFWGKSTESPSVNLPDDRWQWQFTKCGTTYYTSVYKTLVNYKSINYRPQLVHIPGFLFTKP